MSTHSAPSLFFFALATMTIVDAKYNALPGDLLAQLNADPVIHCSNQNYGT